MTHEKMLVAAKVMLEAVSAAVDQGGQMGVPATALYLPLMQHGCTLAQFEVIIAVLVETGMVKRKGDLIVAHGAPPGLDDEEEVLA